MKFASILIDFPLNYSKIINKYKNCKWSSIRLCTSLKYGLDVLVYYVDIKLMI
ncbi:hypothetical protein ACA081_00280 [Candidatus Hodgkinia cicadicola]